MKAFGYVRVSTDRQALSLEAQEAKIRAMATVQGADLEDVIVDGGESARSLNRPGATAIDRPGDPDYLRSQADEIKLRNYNKLLVDLSEVSAIGSTVIGFVVGLFTSISKKADGRFTLAGANSHVRNVLDLTRLSTVIPLAADTRSGLAALVARDRLHRRLLGKVIISGATGLRPQSHSVAQTPLVSADSACLRQEEVKPVPTAVYW